MSHPDGMSALLSGSVECQLTTSPYVYKEATDDSIHEVEGVADAWPDGNSFIVAVASTSLKEKDPELYDAFIKALAEAIDYINNHYKEDINLDIITDVVHISKYHFSRLFHKATGATFLQYLYNVRLVNVHSLLAETNLNLNEIAIRTGFSSSAHLSRIFKQVYNVSPQKFRRMLKEKSKKQ